MKTVVDDWRINEENEKLLKPWTSLRRRRVLEGPLGYGSHKGVYWMGCGTDESRKWRRRRP